MCHRGQLTPAPAEAGKLARLALLLAPVALSPSGRLQLLPHETEVKYGDKVDVEFPDPGGGLAGDIALKYTARVDGAQRRMLARRLPWATQTLRKMPHHRAKSDACTLAQGGVLCVTTHRLVWLSPPGAAQRACGLSLACVAQAVPKPRATFGSRTPRLLVTVHVDASGAVTAGAARYTVRRLATAWAEALWAHSQARDVHRRCSAVLSGAPAPRVSFPASPVLDTKLLRRVWPGGSHRRSCCRDYSLRSPAEPGRSRRRRLQAARPMAAAVRSRRPPPARSCARRTWAWPASFAARRLPSNHAAAAWRRHSRT